MYIILRIVGALGVARLGCAPISRVMRRWRWRLARRRTHVDAVPNDNFKAVVREVAAKAAQKASLKRARGNAGDPAPPPAPSVPPARTPQRISFLSTASLKSRDRRRVLTRGRGLRWIDSEFRALRRLFHLAAQILFCVYVTTDSVAT